MKHISKKLSFLALFALSTTANASSQTEHLLIAPACLISQTHAKFETLAVDHSLSLIATQQDQIKKFTAAKAIKQTMPCGSFKDVTDAWQKYSSSFKTKEEKNLAFLKKYTTPKADVSKTYTIQYKKQVTNTLALIQPEQIWSNLTALTNFKDRYAMSATGAEAATWIETKVKSMAAEYNRSDVTIYTIATGGPDLGYTQPSVIMKIGTSDKPGVVVSAHMDTMESYSSPKPGADDDGSGSVTVLETARAVLASGMQFKKPIYFMWFAAEEEGLVGSYYVVSQFTAKGIPIDGVLHFDMTGYRHNNEDTMWLVNDSHVNKNLTRYLKSLIETYVKQEVKYTACGYDCSDHASWTDAGYPASVATETAYRDCNPDMHTSQDTMDKLSLSHMTDFAKLATAFAVELGEPLN